MANNYSSDLINSLVRNGSPIILELNDNNVYIGILISAPGNGQYRLEPLTINESAIVFRRSHIKRIIYFNGLIVPKNPNSLHRILDIIDLSEIVNKAGYQFT